MKYSKLFVSLIASSLLLCAEDSEVQVSFTTSSSDKTHKVPTMGGTSQYKWDDDKKQFIFGVVSGDVISASFASD